MAYINKLWMVLVSKSTAIKLSWWGAPFLLLCVVYFASGLWRDGNAIAQAPAGGPPVGIATVTGESVTEWQEFSGMFEAVRKAEVRPQVSGKITQIHFEDGAQVAEGQPLFTIDPRPYAAEATRAQGALTTAAAAHTAALQEFERAKKLVDSGAISKSEFDQKQSALQQAIGALQSARGALNAAQVNLGYTKVVAPIAGKISRAEITEGNVVDAMSAPLLASIVDLSPMYASFEVDETTFLKTIQGVSAERLKTIPVEVGIGNGATAYVKAAIHSFDNQITPGSGTIRVRAILENADETLVPGIYAKVRMGTVDPIAAVLIHPTAVGTDQDKKFVMVVDAQSKAQYRPVVLGQMVDGLQAVKDGLKPGEKIVVTGLQRARPDSPITGAEVDMKTLQPVNAPEAVPPAATPDAAAQ